jgi:hypothetical protein
MKKEEFDEIIYNKAVDYAYDVILDPEDHLDAIDEVISDFMAGADCAWNLLRPNYNDKRAIC